MVVSGFDPLLPHDFEILTGIANLPSMKMGTILDFDEENKALFEHIRTDYNRFLNCGFERHSGATETPEASPQFALRSKSVYTDQREEPAIEKLSLTDQISLLCPPRPNPRGGRNCQVNQATRVERVLTDIGPDLCHV